MKTCFRQKQGGDHVLFIDAGWFSLYNGAVPLEIQCDELGNSCGFQWAPENPVALPLLLDDGAVLLHSLLV